MASQVASTEVDLQVLEIISLLEDTMPTWTSGVLLKSIGALGPVHSMEVVRFWEGPL